MRRETHAIRIDITIEAPYAVHGSDPGRYGLDTTLLKNHRGRPIIPGTLVAGRIAEAWEGVGSALGGADRVYWFGAESMAGQGATRARLRVDDLVLERITIDDKTAKVGNGEISRIRLNDDTGAVESGSLLLIEQIAPPGATMLFSGTWHTWATTDEIEQLLPQLRGALLVQTQLGAFRGVGFGRLRGVDVDASVAQTASLTLNQRQRSFRLALGGDATLCVGAQGRRGNVFESSDVVTGGTILGTLASMIAARHGAPDLDSVNTPLARHFSDLRCTHALPSSSDEGRPMPLPQSLISFGDVILDGWSHGRPPSNLDLRPAFQTDWKDKDFSLVRNRQLWGETRRQLRVRTRIDHTGKAMDEHLFAYESIYAPLDDDGAPMTQWLFDIDLRGIDDNVCDAVRDELEELLAHGLFPVGKTDAILTVDRIDSNQRDAGSVWESAIPRQVSKGDRLPLVLVTDALLFPTDKIAGKADVDLTAIYRSAFDSLGAMAGYQGALQLQHFFATQRLVGGEFLKRQFMTTKCEHYQPWVLTEAGSVFVFEVIEPQSASELLRQWQDHGLDCPQPVQAAYGNSWRDHPYRRQAGYGEVAVNPQHGFDLFPGEQRQTETK